jgi:hypothetical protein
MLEDHAGCIREGFSRFKACGWHTAHVGVYYGADQLARIVVNRDSCRAMLRSSCTELGGSGAGVGVGVGVGVGGPRSERHCEG